MKIKKGETNNAIVTELKNIRKHSNADRLQIATVCGDTVIVGLDAKENDKVIYFDSNLCLSLDFLKENNLFQKGENNKDNTKRGFFGNQGRVKPTNLRGEKSYGFTISIESITEFVGANVDEFKIGMEFNDINDIYVCKKYINLKQAQKELNQNNNKNGVSNKVKTLSFPEHWSTKHFKRCVENIPTDRLLYIEEKEHGCLPSNSKIRMADNSLKKIKDIKKGDMVFGYNHEEKRIVKTKVLNTFINGKTDEWVIIKYYRDIKFKGEKRGKLICTKNHKILSTNMKYKKAENCKVGDSVYFELPYFRLTEIQKNILIGKLLGDGSFSLSNKRQITYSHGIKQKEYFDWTNEILNDVITQNVDTQISGFGTEMYRMNSKNNLAIEQLVNLVFDNDRRLSSELVNYITPLTFAIWYMDDGSLSHNEKQKDRASFAICRYSDECCKIIKKCFEQFNIDIKIYKDSKGYNRGRLNHKDADKFFKMIRKFIPEPMQYKLPQEHRGYYEKLEAQNKEDSKKLIKTKINHIATKKSNEIKYSTKYDFETETHNYIAQGLLIHNSSQRSAYVKYYKDLNWIENILVKLGVKIETMEWLHMNGTRRVNLTKKPNTNSFYKGDMRDVSFNKVKDHLHKGEQLYFEISGYDTTGSWIQKNFPYGCKLGEHITTLYRITMNMEDGKAYDMGREYVYNRAVELGMNKPHLFEKYFYTGNVDELISKVESYTDGKSMVDGKTLREGVVIWFEDKEGKWTCLKNKSFDFLNHESKIKDDENFVDIEDES